MSERRMVTIDGNQAAAHVAHRLSEVVAIYPITPSSNMGEWSDEWAAQGIPNIWGTVPLVQEMQSEGGAAGSVHGAAITGALTTTFTASQGLLLMIPTMFKMGGELTPTVFHVSARTVATHALSIFGDHSDVMACRGMGYALLASGSVQEVMDLATIAHASTLKSRLPFLHFFDGFRTSHEVLKMQELTDDDLKAMIDQEQVAAHRARGLSPDRPMLRGTSQNPDVFFQARETVNPYYDACPQIVQEQMDLFSERVGRQYRLFDYVGAADAERVIVLMGSAAETAHETVEFLQGQGEKVGIIKVRLYRPFSLTHFAAALPKSTQAIAVLDRTKEPGSAGEPLYQDVLTALAELGGTGQLPTAQLPKIVGGRYGLSSKEFTPAMVKAVFDNLKQDRPRNHFTVGIHDDVTHTSLEYDPSFVTEPDDVVRCMFYGLGSDGTVGANKNSIKIIGEETDNNAQGYFVYDSKKAGSMTVSHLRFGPRPIRSSYLITSANFVACHNWAFLEKYDMLAAAVEGSVFLLNSPFPQAETWDRMPKKVQQQIIDKKLQVYAIDAYHVAKETGMGARINTIMQTCFFAISGVLPKDEAIAQIKDAIKKTYGKKGDEIVKRNWEAVDSTLANLYQIEVPAQATSTIEMPPAVAPAAPAFVRDVLGKIIAGQGDTLPVSAFPQDGTFPIDTARWEKRNIALEIPVWDESVCIQCGKCAIVCPHASIRMKVYDPKELAEAPDGFKTAEAIGKDFPEMNVSVQVAPEDCTGCGLCVEVCPAKNKQEVRLKAINMAFQPPIREREAKYYDFFLALPEVDRSKVNIGTVKGSQFLQPLFEYSGACAGCGETPYYKLLTQLFGDRALIANATGCSSIYGGNLPTTPFAKNPDGRGPTWCNSLFEDNAEFGYGYRLTLDKQHEYAAELLKKQAAKVGAGLVEQILSNPQKTEAEIAQQREAVAQLKQQLQGVNGSHEPQDLLALADVFVKKSVWIVGGDGWAYDIGYGGLDHVLAQGRNVNVLVLNTEVYSNTGGQCSKATPRAAVAKFAASGKPQCSKDLSLMAMAYGNVYVAQIAMGANDQQTVRAFLEAESYDGPALINAYSHCIAQGINMRLGMDSQKLAVQSGHFPLFRFNPALAHEGKNPLKMDSKKPTVAYQEYAYKQNRFKMLTKSKPERAADLIAEAQQDVQARWQMYEHMATRAYDLAQMKQEA